MARLGKKKARLEDGPFVMQIVASRDLLRIAFFAFVAFFRRAAFLLGFEALFFAFGPFLGAFHQFRTHQFEHGQFRAIALTRSEAGDTSVATCTLAKS